MTGLAVSKARGLEVEEFSGGVVGFLLPEEAAEPQAPPSALAGGRRRRAG